MRTFWVPGHENSQLVTFSIIKKVRFEAFFSLENSEIKSILFSRLLAEADLNLRGKGRQISVYKPVKENSCKGQETSDKELLQKTSCDKYVFHLIESTTINLKGGH